MHNCRFHYLHAMGIQVWKRRSPPIVPAATPQVNQPTAHNPPASPSMPSTTTLFTEAPPDWSTLQHQVAICQACALHQTRTQTVFGIGCQSADWLFIGEAPGEEEDKQGIPFVGPAGKLFDHMLDAMQLEKNTIYLTNVLKCHPPRNRNPKVKEITSCSLFLQHQIQLIQPKLIVALGAVAARHLLAVKNNVGELRGQYFRYMNIPLIATYHPAFLLRRPLEKRQAWQDLQFILRTFTAITQEES
jgi:DNA polymerase